VPGSYDFTVDIDEAAMREALEGESLRAVIKGFIKGASRISADNIAADAKARLERQLSGQSSGQTVEGIIVKSDRTGWGWIVDAGNARIPMLPRWLEGDPSHGGFKNENRRKPFFYDSARVEQSPHERRVSSAIQAALSQYGLAEGQG
jgi:hypothetical protein